MNTIKLAQKIKEKCKELNITISKLIEECNLSKSLIYDLEKRNTYISIDKLFKIATYLNCSSDYLLGLNENITILDENKFNIQEERIIKVFNSLNNEYKNIAINEIFNLLKNNIDTNKLEIIIKTLDDDIKEDILNILIDLSLQFSDEQIKKANENKKYIAALGGGVTELTDEDLANYIIENAVPNKRKAPNLKNL